MLPHSANRAAVAVLLLSGLLTPAASAQIEQPVSDLRDRVGIVYMIGTVERVVRGASVLDLGDAHMLQARDRVAVFRPEDAYLRPVGTLRIAETFGATSIAERPDAFQAQAGDVVMFVRELSQLQTAPDHLNYVLAARVVRRRFNSHVAVPGRPEAATALLHYHKQQPQWVRNLGSDPDRIYIVGEHFGASLAGGIPERVRRLLNQVNLLRELHRDGTAAVAAAGPEWAAVMPVLFGQTVTEDAAATENVVADGSASTDTSDLIRRIRREVDYVLFDRPQEERNLLAALLAARLKNPGGSDDLWFQVELPKTQFPSLVTNDQILEDLRNLLRTLRS